MVFVAPSTPVRAEMVTEKQGKVRRFFLGFFEGIEAPAFAVALALPNMSFACHGFLLIKQPSNAQFVCALPPQQIPFSAD
jgi:hypothetical protein